MRHPDLRCYLVETTIVHAIVAESPRAAARIAREEIATSSPYEADRVTVTPALAAPSDPRALDALPSWADAEPDDPRRAWTLRRWIKHQRGAR